MEGREEGGMRKLQDGWISHHEVFVDGAHEGWCSDRVNLEVVLCQEVWVVEDLSTDKTLLPEK